MSHCFLLPRVGQPWAADRHPALLTCALVSPAQHQALSEYRPIMSEVHRLQHHSSMADKKLVLIPLIFICLRVWSTVRFVLTLCGSPAVQTPVLVVLHVRRPALPGPAAPSRGDTSQCLRSTVPSFLPEIGSLGERRRKVSVALL